MSIDNSRYRSGRPRVETIQQKIFNDTVESIGKGIDSAELNALADESNSLILDRAARTLDI